MRFGESRCKSTEEIQLPGRTQHPMKNHLGDAPWSVMMQRNMRELWALLWFLWEGEGKAEHAGIGVANLNDFSDWSIGPVLGCRVLGPGAIRVSI